MSDHDFGHAAGDPLPDRLKQYLTDMARRELDTLRADLEVRLVALETALARPDQHHSIETLVFDLARAATLEAEAAASRAMLAAQIEAQERTGTADALRDLEAERNAVKALRAEFDQLRSRAEADLARMRAEHKELSEKLAAAQRDLSAAQHDLKEARKLADARASDLTFARDAAGAAQAEAAARVKTLEAKIKTLEGQAAEAERIRRDAVARADAANVLARETAARASNAESWGRDVETRLQAAEARATRDEERVRDAEGRLREAETRVGDAETRARDLEARARDAEAHAHDLETRARDAEARANLAAGARDALVAEIDALKETIAREQEGQASRHGADAARLQDYEHRLAAADERVRTLELQLFQRDRPEAGVEDEELSGMLAASGQAPFKPTRAASRYSFSGGVNVEIDGRVGALVDLSTSGAQILGPVPLDEGNEAELRLMSDEIPAVCRGRIVWTRIEPKSPRQPLRYRAGLLFTQVDVGAIEAFIIRYAAT